MKHQQHTLYHATLRVSALLLALLLLVVSGIFSPVTSQLAYNTELYVANVIGVGASVEPTELNTITAALTAKERELAAREKALSEREISVGLSTGDQEERMSAISTYILSVLLFIIIVLLVLNYALDFARERHLRALQDRQHVNAS